MIRLRCTYPGCTRRAFDGIMPLCQKHALACQLCGERADTFTVRGNICEACIDRLGIPLDERGYPVEAVVRAHVRQARAEARAAGGA